jgi:hypothetical protein
VTTSYFINNSAADAGGAIKWDDLEPNFDTTVFKRMHNNTAKLYGNDIACFAQNLVLLEEDTYVK